MVAVLQYYHQSIFGSYYMEFLLLGLPRMYINPSFLQKFFMQSK